MDMERFSQRLIALREDAGHSQADLARLLGKNQAIISRLESGQGPQPGLRTLTQLASFFNVSIDYLAQDDSQTLRRARTYDILSGLVEDSFWATVLRDVPVDAAVYGYLVMSGMPKEQAKEIACPDGGKSTELLDREATPVFSRAFLTGGVSQFWMTSICREIGDDRTKTVAERLEAVRLAAHLSGFLQQERIGSDTDVYASRTSITDLEGRRAVLETVRTRLAGLGEGLGLVATGGYAPPDPPLGIGVGDEDEGDSFNSPIIDLGSGGGRGTSS